MDKGTNNGNMPSQRESGNKTKQSSENNPGGMGGRLTEAGGVLE